MKKRYRNQTAKEKLYYDSLYQQGDYLAKSRFQKWLFSLSPAMPNPKECVEKVLKTLGEVRDRQVCELGCGTGMLTYELAKRGAVVSAIDISAEAVKITREKVSMFSPAQIKIRQMDACDLSFKDNSFDIITGTFILHHIDILKAASEIKRVLKPGGQAVFSEPLAHNPISNIWRRLTPDVRTANEWPLSYSEISEMSKHFSSVNCEEFDLLPLLSSLIYLITFSHKAKDRSAELLARLDSSFLKLCKPLRRYSGEILVVFTK
jgi:ubiquinone/menaquinone biosynthesis C-methylase UbiE